MKRTRFASKAAVLEYGTASSNNPVECLKLEIRKRSFLLRRSNKSQLNDYMLTSTTLILSPPSKIK